VPKPDPLKIVVLIDSPAGHQSATAIDGCDMSIHKTGNPARDLAPLFDALRA
jgi:hypothetical protein